MASMPEDTTDSGGAAKTVPPAAGHLADGSSYREGQTVPLLDGDHEKDKKNRNTNLIDFEEEGDQVEDSDDKDTTTAVYIAGRTALSNSEARRTPSRCLKFPRPRPSRWRRVCRAQAA